MLFAVTTCFTENCRQIVIKVKVCKLDSTNISSVGASSFHENCYQKHFFIIFTMFSWEVDFFYASMVASLI